MRAVAERASAGRRNTLPAGKQIISLKELL